MNNCEFCAWIQKCKDDDEYYISERRHKEDYHIQYTAALVKERYYNGQFIGDVIFKNYSLNFCPVCSKSINNSAIE